MHSPTTILIVDDHPVFRKGLRDIIQPLTEFRIVGEAENGEVALRLIDELRPMIAIVDIEMPLMSGFELVRGIHARQISVDIIFLTMYKEEDMFNAAMDLGISGYVLKENAIHDILECIRVIASGSYYISPLLSAHLIHRTDRQRGFQHKHGALALLTSTERRILQLIAENKTSEKIAEELCVCCKTIENHRMDICNKLNLHGPHNLLRFALENKSCL